MPDGVSHCHDNCITTVKFNTDRLFPLSQVLHFNTDQLYPVSNPALAARFCPDVAPSSKL